MHIGLSSGGDEDESFSVSALVGSTSPHAKNYFLINLPPIGPFALQRNTAQIRNLFTELVGVLQPSQGVVCASNAIMWEGSRLSSSIPSLAKHGDAV
ncbi:MAG: hypothetical protein JF586_15185 [Burkholderiales bacterium]|nr:hypothetical protein [Burkholderiales bacterium]